MTIQVDANDKSVIEDIVQVTIDNLDTVMENTLVVLDFYADWCGPCKQFMPTFISFASDKYAGATYGKINADEQSEIVNALGVRALPTILVFKNGTEVARKVGLMSKTEFTALIDNA